MSIEVDKNIVAFNQYLQDGLYPMLFKDSEQILIFGGGGLLPSLKALFPQSDHVSSRSVELAESIIKKKYQHLIWAARPDADWNWSQICFENVWDLNYHEYSLARELALRRACPYLSGRAVFIAQGLFQQRFWSTTHHK